MVGYPDGCRNIPGDDDDAHEKAADYWYYWVAKNDRLKIDIARKQFANAIEILESAAASLSNLESAEYVRGSNYDEFNNNSNFENAVWDLKASLQDYGLFDWPNRNSDVEKYYLIDSNEEDGLELIIEEERGSL
jgi:hypothetical protein